MKKQIPLFQVDAFSAKPFGGNPAAVCPLGAWLDDAILQAIANENNLSETAFFVKRTDSTDAQPSFDLRWLTPVYEVDLCGHATLASAWVVLERLAPEASSVVFHTRSGPLTVERAPEGALRMDFPARTPQPSPGDGVALARALDVMPLEVWSAAGVLIGVLESAAQVRALAPHMEQIAALNARAVAVTAPGEDGVDFVSRFFAPRAGIPEDPVTGSLHCALTPLWANKLSKTSLRAKQLSKRGGDLMCAWRGERVLITGHATLVIEGVMWVDG